MRNYLDLLQYILDKGIDKEDRTGTGTRSVFGYQLRCPLSEGFPSIIHELLWFLRGDTNTGYLNRNGVTIWDEWADKNGDLGPVYGKQWRSWETSGGQTIDQIGALIEGLKTNPDGRRHIVSAWNVGDIPRMALPPCHVLFQFYVANGKLSCQLYQRSADVFLGVPFNIASYALLTLIVAQVCGYDPGEYIHTFGDVHIYKNHMDQVRLQLSRTPRPLPQMVLNPERRGVFGFEYTDFSLQHYDPYPAIKAPVAV